MPYQKQDLLWTRCKSFDTAVLPALTDIHNYDCGRLHSQTMLCCPRPPVPPSYSLVVPCPPLSTPIPQPRPSEVMLLLILDTFLHSE